MKEICITAIEMPGNIQKPFYELQTALFRRYKIPSARLFPPIIPIRPEKMSETEMEMWKHDFRSIAELKAQTILMQGGGGYFCPLEILPVQNNQEKNSGLACPPLLPGFSPYKAGIRQDHSMGFLSLFSYPAPAVCIAVYENTSDKPGSSAVFSLPSRGQYDRELRWKKMFVAEIRILYSDRRPWWREVYWEYTKYLKISCGGQ